VNLDEVRTLFSGENATKIKGMIDQLDAIDAEMATLADKRRNLDTELNTLLGNVPRQPRAPRTSSGNRRTGIRDEVLAAITNNPGIAVADIRTALGVEGKSGTQSVSNAISALKKDGKIKDTSPRHYAPA
jgi:hypothetical protein